MCLISRIALVYLVCLLDLKKSTIRSENKAKKKVDALVAKMMMSLLGADFLTEG